mgnify:CR=1 FL=1
MVISVYSIGGIKMDKKEKLKKKDLKIKDNLELLNKILGIKSPSKYFIGKK